MAQQDLEKLILQLDANLRGYEKELARAQGVTTSRLRAIERKASEGANRIEAAYRRMGMEIRNGLLNAFGAITFGAIVGQLNQLVKKFAEVKDNADRAGVSAEFLQALNLTGLGAGAKDMTDLLQKFNLEIGEAATKGSYLADILAANNVPLRDANGQIRETKDLFFDVVDLIADARTQQEAAVIAMAAFGKGAKDSLPFLMQGSAAIRAGMQAAKDAGAIVDEELVKAADEFSDAWEVAWATFEGRAAQGVLKAGKWFADLDAAVKSYARSWGIAPIDPWTGKILDPGQRGDMASRGGPKGQTQTSNAGAKGDRFTIVPDPKDTAEIGRQAEAVDKLIESLKFERDQLNESALQQEINNALRQAGTSITEEQRRAIIDNVTAIYDWNQAVAEAKRAGEEWADQQREMAAAAKQEAQQMHDAFQDAFGGLVASTEDGKVKLKELMDVLGNLRSRLMQMAADKVFDILFGNPQTGQQGLVQQFLFPARASGGPVSAGQPYMVGEQGRELFVPKQDGAIIPNGALGGGGDFIINDYAGVSIARRETGAGSRRSTEIDIEARLARSAGDTNSPLNNVLNMRGARQSMKIR